MRLVLIWFVSWKNGDSTYPPLWVKTNPQRFPVQRRKPRSKQNSGLGDIFRGQRDLPLSPLGEASMLADARAFRALMHHIKEVDPQHTVIMIQVENEMGLLGDSRDRSPLADAAWAKPVPAELRTTSPRTRRLSCPRCKRFGAARATRLRGLGRRS